MQFIPKKFLVTGFGPFGDVEANPTTELMKSLSKEEKEQLNIIDADILEVSMKGVEDYQNRLSKLEEKIDENCVFLHFGVRRDIKKVYIEQCSYNNAHFRMPDRQNEQPQNTKILQEQELDECNKTVIDCTKLLESNQYLQENCTISTDPGRFLCNYVYFKSRTTYPTTPSLFIHVPHFTDIDFETQKNVLKQLVNSLSNNTFTS